MTGEILSRHWAQDPSVTLRRAGCVEDYLTWCTRMGAAHHHHRHRHHHHHHNRHHHEYDHSWCARTWMHWVSYNVSTQPCPFCCYRIPSWKWCNEISFQMRCTDIWIRCYKMIWWNQILFRIGYNFISSWIKCNKFSHCGDPWTSSWMIVLRGFYVQWQTLTLTAKLGFSVVFLEDRWILCSVVILTNIDFYCEIRFFSFILGPWGSVAAEENWSETKLSSVLVNIGVPERQHHVQYLIASFCRRNLFAERWKIDRNTFDKHWIFLTWCVGNKK